MMKSSSLAASLLLIILLSTESQHVEGQGGSCEQISNTTRSQICLTGNCPLQCGSANSSEYSQCDQVCVVKPCSALTCNSTNCFQRCLTGKCNSLDCSGGECTQTCLGNCSEVNCTVMSKCNQQCEKGHCGLHARGAGVVVQNCAEKCSDVKCEADDCGQVCEGDGCGLECSKGMFWIDNSLKKRAHNCSITTNSRQSGSRSSENKTRTNTDNWCQARENIQPSLKVCQVTSFYGIPFDWLKEECFLDYRSITRIAKLLHSFSAARRTSNKSF